MVKLRNIQIAFALLLGISGLVMTGFHTTNPLQGDCAISVDSILDCAEACVASSDALHDKHDVLHILRVLGGEGVYLETAQTEPRVKFVQTQGVIEHVLACALALGQIDHLVGVIHTPTPSTPLCVRPNEDPSEGLLHPSIAYDVDKLLTVRSRAQILREYLHLGGILYVVYPRGGLERRTLEQQGIYLETLHAFPDNLFDCMLDHNKMPDHRIGATYLFSDKAGRVFVFSIKNTQANDPRDSVEWGVWFGEVTNPVVETRLKDILHFLESVKGPDIAAQFGL